MDRQFDQDSNIKQINISSCAMILKKIYVLQSYHQSYQLQYFPMSAHTVCLWEHAYAHPGTVVFAQRGNYSPHYWILLWLLLVCVLTKDVSEARFLVLNRTSYVNELGLQPHLTNVQRSTESLDLSITVYGCSKQKRISQIACMNRGNHTKASCKSLITCYK